MTYHAPPHHVLHGCMPHHDLPCSTPHYLLHGDMLNHDLPCPTPHYSFDLIARTHALPCPTMPYHTLGPMPTIYCTGTCPTMTYHALHPTIYCTGSCPIMAYRTGFNDRSYTHTQAKTHFLNHVHATRGTRNQSMCIYIYTYLYSIYKYIYIYFFFFVTAYCGLPRSLERISSWKPKYDSEGLNQQETILSDFSFLKTQIEHLTCKTN